MSHESPHQSQGVTPVATGLLWGIKSSLLSYVRRLPDGAVTIGEGAGLTPAKEFHFPLAETAFDSDASDIIRFRGAVRMRGHQGMLDLILADPWLHFDEASATLSIDPRTGSDEHASRIGILAMPISQPALLGDVEEWAQLQPTLLASGTELFGTYPAATVFDPLSIRVPRRRGHDNENDIRQRRSEHGA